MDPHDYDLRPAYRRMAEFEQQAQHDKLVKTLKEASKEQQPSFWRRAIGYSLIRLGQRLARTSIKSAFVGQTPSSATKDE